MGRARILLIQLARIAWFRQTVTVRNAGLVSSMSKKDPWESSGITRRAFLVNPFAKLEQHIAVLSPTGTHPSSLWTQYFEFWVRLPGNLKANYFDTREGRLTRNASTVSPPECIY